MTTAILRSTPATLQFTVMSDGTNIDFDASPTIAAVDATGTAVTIGGTTHPPSVTGVYEMVLAGQSDLKTVDVTLSGDIGANAVSMTQRYEIVGGFLFTESAARSFQAKADAASENIPLASATEYPDAVIAAERDAITSEIESWCGRSFVPRYGRVRLAGNGTALLSIGAGQRLDGGAGGFRDITKLLSVTINDVAVSDLTTIEIDPMGYLSYKTATFAVPSSGFTNVVVEYEYGVANLRDNVNRIGLILLLEKLVPRRPEAFDLDVARPIRPGGKYGNRSHEGEVNQWLKEHDMRRGFA